MGGLPIELAKTRGAYQGRQKSLSAEQILMISDAIRSGVTKARIARNLGVSRETIYRYLREHDLPISR